MINFTETAELYYGMLYIILGIAVLALSKVIVNLMSPYKINKELVHSDNQALGVTLAGYYAGVVIIFLGAVIGENEAETATFGSLFLEAVIDLGYAVFGIFALNLCRKVVDMAILYKFSTVKEIITDRNIGTGAVEAGAMIATALMIAGAINGAGSLLSTLVFFVLGMGLLILFSHFHAFLTPYDDHDEIEKDNVAAGAYLGFSLVALGIIVLKATAGDFISWGYNLSWFAGYAIIGFLGLAVLQKLILTVFLPGANIEEEISRDRNMNIAWIGGTMSIGVAALIFFLL
ncbi:MAG: DUF350 domain-containing protein [Candidatus Electrothrix aestuarii]|uniref:DUF350 domain-containing protein n=1 Tax=Candidatus Electrothrix aestuarii TaxID=3062594 RepID=A0AAU8LXG8_9BACT|nr:DUF350 domain-containing protein [Candidatus Electrothrix aestuarii]